MGLLTVDKIKKQITMALSDQTQITGHVFLSPCSELGVGRQSLLDALTARERFIPFETLTGEWTFLNQSHVVWVASLLEKDMRMQNVPPERRNVAVHLQGGKRLRGDAVMALPEDKNRLSDLLNEVGQFLVLQDEKREVLVNVDYIIRVE